MQKRLEESIGRPSDRQLSLACKCFVANWDSIGSFSADFSPIVSASRHLGRSGNLNFSLGSLFFPALFLSSAFFFTDGVMFSFIGLILLHYE